MFSGAVAPFVSRVDAVSIPTLAQLSPEQAAFTANNFNPTNYPWHLSV